MAAKSWTGVVAAGAVDAVHTATGFPEEEVVDTVVGMVDMGTWAAQAEQLVGRRCYAHVDHEYLVSLQKQVNSTAECGRILGGMGETFEWLPLLLDSLKYLSAIKSRAKNGMDGLPPDEYVPDALDVL